MKRTKIPKQGRKQYHKGYNNGYRRGQLKAAEGMVDKFRKTYPKIATAAQEMKQGYQDAKKEAEPSPLFPTPQQRDSWRWQGFTEAMNLIIQARR